MIWINSLYIQPRVYGKTFDSKASKNPKLAHKTMICSTIQAKKCSFNSSFAPLHSKPEIKCGITEINNHPYLRENISKLIAINSMKLHHKNPSILHEITYKSNGNHFKRFWRLFVAVHGSLLSKKCTLSPSPSENQKKECKWNEVKWIVLKGDEKN